MWVWDKADFLEIKTVKDKKMKRKTEDLKGLLKINDFLLEFYEHMALKSLLCTEDICKFHWNVFHERKNSQKSNPQFLGNF